MTIQSTFAVRCDHCGAWGAESDETEGDARFWAEREGWHCEDEHDLCPKCWAKWERREK